jgi:hypothetical protein
LGLKTGGDGFLWFGLKTGEDGFSWFSLKTGGSGFPVWASKLTATVCDLGLKITATVSWFGPQN